MSELTKETCAFARDHICRLPPEECATCKLTKEDSDFHLSLCIGGITYDEVEEMCGGKLKGGFWRKKKGGEA